MQRAQAQSKIRMPVSSHRLSGRLSIFIRRVIHGVCQSTQTAQYMMAQETHDVGHSRAQSSALKTSDQWRPGPSRRKVRA